MEKASARALLLGYLYLAARNCRLIKQTKNKKENKKKEKTPQIPTYFGGEVCLNRVQDALGACVLSTGCK